MAKWADFLAENKTPSNPNKPKSDLSTAHQFATQDKVDYLQLYLDRLNTLLKHKVAIGELTTAQATDIGKTVSDSIAGFPKRKYRNGKIYNLNQINDAFKTLPILPYAEDVSVSNEKWIETTNINQVALQKFQKEQQVNAIKLQAAKRSYLPQFRAYLDEAVKNKTITQEQASQLYQTEESQLDLGVKPSDLQNYEGVTEWVKSLEVAGKEKAQEERQTKIATGEAMGSVFQTQADISQREDLISRKQAELDRIATQGRTAQISRGISNSLMRGGEAQQRAELFKQFEDVRQQKLSQLDPEMDWVQRWFVEHEENPNTPIIPTTQDRIDQLGSELQKWQDIGQHYADTPVNVGDTVTWGQIADESKVRIMQMLEDIKNAPPDGSDSITAPREVAPATPEWLSKLVPGLKTGQPIKSNVELPTPSLQEWGRLSPSTQTQYAGFSKWAGIPIKDTLARMNLMRPETPKGAGRFGWNVARQ